jgi:hypothetical protein
LLVSIKLVNRNHIDELEIDAFRLVNDLPSAGPGQSPRPVIGCSWSSAPGAAAMPVPAAIAVAPTTAAAATWSASRGRSSFTGHVNRHGAHGVGRYLNAT